MKAVQSNKLMHNVVSSGDYIMLLNDNWDDVGKLIYLSEAHYSEDTTAVTISYYDTNTLVTRVVPSNTILKVK